ncbi:MAG TPA: efflux RND transporter permease subunit, partial [Terriglobia bacterium]|nr:efflux RND transporter permease subunit [Terriglobia bacterium]
VVAGIASYFTLGQLEDPEFTIKNAVVVTAYPGASPEEVELEVTDRLELAIQQMPQVKYVSSFSRQGLSQITVAIRPEYRSGQLPQIWNELRRKVGDTRRQFPPGVGEPRVVDDFGDVYGFLLGVVADGFSEADLERYVDGLRKELSLVNGVARVEVWGVQPECIYLDVSQSRLANAGVSVDQIRDTVQQQNLVVDAGAIDIANQRVQVKTTGMFRTPEDIADLSIRGGPAGKTEPAGLVRLGDIAEVRRDYQQPSAALMRVDGRPAIGVAITNQPGVSIVKLGLALDRRLAELTADLPAGIEIQRVAWQGDLVSHSIVDFVRNLIAAILIVLAVLWIAMGLRPALVVGITGLVLVILGTFIFMAVLQIDLQRMSLGALVIAMGMMVDNAIVVVDNMIVRLGRGMNREKAAIESASKPAMPLLGATAIAILAFYPIAASTENAGEYCASLFSMVAISLGFSWLVAVTVTPVIGMAMLASPKVTEPADPYGSRFFRAYRKLLTTALRMRIPVLLVFVALLIGSGVSFRFVNQMFFPNSSRPQFMVDVWLPEGTRIEETSEVVSRIEKLLANRYEIQSVASFIGQGPPRFYLPVEPEKPYSSYGQLIVSLKDFRDTEKLMHEIDVWASKNLTDAKVIPRKYGLGPSETWSVRLRISGPAVADPGTLRRLADEAKEIIAASPQTKVARTDWRQRVPTIVAEYDITNGRWTNVDRKSIADATRRAFDGVAVGIYRQQDKLLPIVLRAVDSEREEAAAALPNLQVSRPLGGSTIPLGQVTRDIRLGWEDPLIWRWDRRRAVTVQAVPVGLATELRTPELVEKIAKIKLPPGYTMEWDGEYKNSRDAQASLIPGIVPAALIVALILVWLFNSYRKPLIIVLIIPFAIIGVTLGLLITRQPFGFVALLAAMSLAGMMIKNAIVLVDEIGALQAAGQLPFDAVVNAAVFRLRPVLLAAGTTVLGVIPLLTDVFWISMSVVIMFGLTIGTVITMVLLPTIYSLLFGITDGDVKRNAAATPTIESA